MTTEGTWLSLASIGSAARSVASVPAAAGYVSVGAVLLLGRSTGQALGATSRALDQIAANTAQLMSLWRRAASRPDVPAAQASPARDFVELECANESQWIIWLDET